MACTTKLSITGSSSRICDREPAASSHLNKGANVRLNAVAVVLRTESNRTEPDRILGLIGGGSGESALVAALSTPYRLPIPHGFDARGMLSITTRVSHASRLTPHASRLTPHASRLTPRRGPAPPPSLRITTKTQAIRSNKPRFQPV